MAIKDIEIEIQVQVEKSAGLLDFLNENGEFKGEKRQVDEYFTPSHRDFLAVRPAKEWLRLRDSNGKFSVNYKNWYCDTHGKSHHCDEFESVIEDLEKMRKIFLALDIKPTVKVDKTRKIWVFRDYEIAIDAVVGLGDYVEIEYLGEQDGKDAKAIADEMIKFLKDIDCGKIKRNYVGYPFALLFPDKVEYEII